MSYSLAILIRASLKERTSINADTFSPRRPLINSIAVYISFRSLIYSNRPFFLIARLIAKSISDRLAFWGASLSL